MLIFYFYIFLLAAGFFLTPLIYLREHSLFLHRLCLVNLTESQLYPEIYQTLICGEKSHTLFELLGHAGALPIVFVAGLEVWFIDRGCRRIADGRLREMLRFVLLLLLLLLQAWPIAILRNVLVVAGATIAGQQKLFWSRTQLHFLSVFALIVLDSQLMAQSNSLRVLCIGSLSGIAFNTFRHRHFTTRVFFATLLLLPLIASDPLTTQASGLLATTSAAMAFSFVARVFQLIFLPLVWSSTLLHQLVPLVEWLWRQVLSIAEFTSAHLVFAQHSFNQHSLFYLWLYFICSASCLLYLEKRRRQVQL